MARQTCFCNHYRSMSCHKTCKAGVEYDSLKGIPFNERPCFSRPGDPPKTGCELVQLPTAEQLAEEEREFEQRLGNIGKARQAIVAACGGPWKKGMAGSRGVIDCPACGQSNCLGFTRAGYNGHIHARCTTPSCVSWME